MAGAGSGEHFSIRGYAARAGDAKEGSRCWPFGGEAGTLPPMEVRPFRWWADEAALAEAEEEEEEERRKAAKRRKRSIVELFAAVPRAAGGDGKRIRRKLDKGKLVVGVMQKKGLKKEKVAAEIGVGKKEKSGNIKVTSLGISQLFQDVIQKRKLEKYSSKKKRNQEASVLLNKKSMKGNKKSVLANQKAVKNNCQVQSILKKHLTTGMGTFLKVTDVMCPSKPSRKSKQVTFCDEDDICGLTGSQPEDDTEQSHLLQASQQPSQNGNSQVVDEPQLVYQRVDAISGNVQDGTSSLSEKVGSTGVSRTVPLTKSKEKNILGNSMDLNHCIEMSNRGNYLNSMSSAALSSQALAQNFADMEFRLQEGLYLDVGCQPEENYCNIPQGSSVPAVLAVETRSGDLMRSPLSRPSSSCYIALLKEAYDRNSSTLLQERLAANCHLVEVHPRLLRGDKDIVSSISSSTGSNKSTDAQTTDCVSACRSMYASDDYIGLPLNSHGEFVRVQLGGTLNPNEVFKRRCLGEDSLHPSTAPISFTPRTCTDYANLRINHQALSFCPVANFGIHPEPYLNPTMPTACGTDFRQLPSSERMGVHNYANPNNYSCSNHEERSAQCFCSRCMGQDNQLHKSLEMQSCFPTQNYEKNIQPTSETTMRLMGKTVTLGTSSKHCRDLDNNGPCSSKQIRAEDHYFQGTCTKKFPQLFHGGLVDPPSTFMISNGGRQPSEYASCFSSVPAAELGSGFDINSFRTSNHSQQPQLAVPNKFFVQPLRRYNGVGLGHQRPTVTNQVQSTAKHLQLGHVRCGKTPSFTKMSSYDPKNSIKKFEETRTGPSQFNYFPQKNSNMTQRTTISSFLYGYAVQSTPGLTTQTKFTSIHPLPPSVIPCHVYSSEDAQPHGCTPFHPPVPPSRGTGKINAPGDAIFKDKRSMKRTAIGSNLESSEQINRSCKRPAEKDDVLLTLPKKPCIAVRKDLNLSPLAEEGLELCGSRPDGQPRDMPVRLSEEPEVDLRLVDNNTRTARSDSVNSVRTRPVKLKSGANHILQPCGSSSMNQDDSWTVRSVIQFAVENDACTLSSSKKRDAEIYRV